MSKSDINVQSAFYMEPEEIVKYFKSKECKISFDWHEVYQEAHAKAFTVAKMTSADLLKDTQNLLTKALKEGWSSSHFKKEASVLFEKKGWVGFKEMIDPKTGEKKTVELGTPRRIKKIFDCNMRSAYSAGRYKQQLEDVDIAPYFQYCCILDSKTRPEHRALHGKIFRYNDPIWQSLYPPNGWNCRCYVSSLTEREVNKKGLTVEKSDGNLREIETLINNEPKTLTAYDFKVGKKEYTLIPDAGWANNNGIQAWGLDVAAYDKIKGFPEALKDKFISDMAQNPHNPLVLKNFIDYYVKKGLKNPSTVKEITLSWLSANHLKSLSKNELKTKTPVIVLQDGRIGHTLDKKVTKEDLYSIYDIINNPDNVYLDYTKSGVSALVYTKNIENDMCIKVCVKIGQTNKRTKKSVNYVSTIGKVPQSSLLDKKLYKKIE